MTALWIAVGVAAGCALACCCIAYLCVHSAARVDREVHAALSSPVLDDVAFAEIVAAPELAELAELGQRLTDAHLYLTSEEIDR